MAEEAPQESKGSRIGQSILNIVLIIALGVSFYLVVRLHNDYTVLKAKVQMHETAMKSVPALQQELTRLKAKAKADKTPATQPADTE
jgi:cell division protein FtsB